MAWDYEPAVNGEAISPYCDAIVFQDEGGGGQKESAYSAAYDDGERFDPEIGFATSVFPVTCVLAYDDAGTVDHTDGAGGHAYEHLSHLKRLFSGAGVGVLSRTVPHVGEVAARFRNPGPPTKGAFGQKHGFTWFLRLIEGSWYETGDANSQSGTSPTVTTGGDRRIFDPTIIFSGAGTASVTDRSGVPTQIEAEAGPTFPVTVSRGLGGWRALDDNGDDARGSIHPSQPWWLRLDENFEHSFTSDVSITVQWRNRWA